MTGTLGVLRTAAEAGLIDVKEVVTRLGSTNFYVDEALVEKIFGKWLEARGWLTVEGGGE